jgi:RNA polymerase sigma factor (TIGR02999 family)
MTPGPSQSVTGLLQAWAAGDLAALDELLPLVYDELRRQARRYMRAQPSGHTLQTTALVHEAYLRLVGQSHVEWQDRAHFFGVASKAMRSILVDHARARSAAKRGGAMRAITLEEAGVSAGPEASVDVLALDEAAVVLGVSPATVKRDHRASLAEARAECRLDRP